MLTGSFSLGQRFKCENVIANMPIAKNNVSKGV